MTVPGYKCPKCGSHRIWKKGYVPTIGGKKLRYICTDCGHSFYDPKKTGGKKKSKGGGK